MRCLSARRSDAKAAQRVTRSSPACRRISDYGRRLERQAIAIEIYGTCWGYLLCHSSRKTFLT
jgi:hypothetical protein